MLTWLTAWHSPSNASTRACGSLMVGVCAAHRLVTQAAHSQCCHCCAHACSSSAAATTHDSRACNNAGSSYYSRSNAHWQYNKPTSASIDRKAVLLSWRLVLNLQLWTWPEVLAPPEEEARSRAPELRRNSPISESQAADSTCEGYESRAGRVESRIQLLAEMVGVTRIVCAFWLERPHLYLSSLPILCHRAVVT